MKLLTHFELATRPTRELHRMSRDILNALATTVPGSEQRRIHAASLDNIRAVLRNRTQP